MLAVGDSVELGRYPLEKTEPQAAIKWRVLKREGKKALLISEEVLEFVLYNEKWEAVTWETCTLRRWLNEDFLNGAFSAVERALIAQVVTSNPDNEKYETSGGADTRDRVFCLSLDEAKSLFETECDRRAKTTSWISEKPEYSDWWLRSPGADQKSAAFVYNFGTVYADGLYADCDCVGVRPALWINLES